jgi:hypothetical protein
LGEKDRRCALDGFGRFHLVRILPLITTIPSVDPRYVRIATNLPSLEGLDLSDIPTVFNVRHPWNALFHPQQSDKDHERTKCIADLYQRLTWLSMPDVRNPPTMFARSLVESTLPHCHGLRTLSIRGQRFHEDVLDPHDYVHRLPDLVAEHTPKSVTTLELRLPFPFLDELRDALKKNGSNITNIGIDLGAWIQDCPKQKIATNLLSESQVKEAARTAARKRRFEAYEQAHNGSVRANSIWLLPKTHFDQDLHGLAIATPGYVKDVSDNRSYSVDGEHAFEDKFYLDDDTPNRPVVISTTEHLCDLEHTQAVSDSHAKILRYLEYANPSTLPMMLNHLHKMASECPNFKFFALKPEWQTNSTKPVHPFALLQRMPSSSSSNGKTASLTTLQPEVYEWFNTTFNWRPVFDWDWFMKSENETSEENSTSTRGKLLQRWSLNTSYSHDKLLSDIAKHFKALKNAGIPIHILIGRRHPESSSLYWGWPYDEDTWKNWLDAPFTANLKSIAPLVDTLSILYDLRNYLPGTRLTPNNNTAESTTCPRPICPWTKANQPCPFPKQWSHTTSTTAIRKQKMANKRHLGATPALAPDFPYLPPTGQYANDHNPLSEDSLRDIAAFNREAVAWQRFWNTYAYTFTSLSELNVRMPRCFDKVGSMKLARLLDPEKGWGMRAFADESGGSGGVFVRRTWVRKEGGELEMEEDEEVERGEKKHLEKAVGRAAASAKFDSAMDEENGGVEDRLGRMARRTWETRMKEYIAELRANTGVDAVTREVLNQTIRSLEAQIEDYRPEEVFGVSGGLVRHARDYAAEEDLKRKGLALNANERDDGESDPDDAEFYEEPVETEQQQLVLLPETGNVEEDHDTDLDAELFGSELPDVLPLPGIDNTDLYGDTVPGLGQAPVNADVSGHQDVLRSAQLEDILATLDRYRLPAQPITPQTNLDEILETLQSLAPQALGVEVDTTRWENTVIQDGEMKQAVESVENLHTEYVSVRAGAMGAHAPRTPSRLRESTTPVAEITPAREVTPPREVIPLRNTHLSEQLMLRETAMPRGDTSPAKKTPSKKPKSKSDPAPRESTPTRETAPPSEPAPLRERASPKEPTLSAEPRATKKPKIASESTPTQPASGKQPPSVTKTTQLKEPTPANQSSTPQEQPPPKDTSPPKKAQTAKAPSPTKDSPPAKPAPSAREPPARRPPVRKPPIRKPEPEPEPPKQTPEPLSPPTPPSPPSSPPLESSPLPTKPKPTTRRRRKDPVLTEAIDPPDLSCGRRLRSRSATPTVSYKETSDEEGDGDGDVKGKGKKKGRKRKVDDDWGEEDVENGEGRVKKTKGGRVGKRGNRRKKG